MFLRLVNLDIGWKNGKLREKKFLEKNYSNKKGKDLFRFWIVEIC